MAVLNNNILEIEDVSIAYNKKTVVENISFAVKDQDYFCLIGSNGSGKSSLLKGLLGLVPITSGKINFAISKKQIGYLPQINSIPENFPATVEELVLTGRQNLNNKYLFYNKADYSAAANALDLLKITKLINKPFAQLSGGERQRVLLARALARKPKLLFLDEPCTGLDEDIQIDFYSLLDKLNKELAVTIFMISHDLDEVSKYAKHIAVIKKSLIFYGTNQKWHEEQTKKSQRLNYF